MKSAPRMDWVERLLFFFVPPGMRRARAASNTRFVSFWRRIHLVDVSDDIFSAILTALKIVRCFPFQNAFSGMVRFI